VLEYTPHHFQGRGTDYATLLPRFLSQTGDDATCYALHRTLPVAYRILPADVHVFYQTLYEAQTQTDLYCCLLPATTAASDRDNGTVGTDVLYDTAPVWTVSTHLDG
jgi:hypothetical protein